MMISKVAIINGHPDPALNRFCHAFAASYLEGARESGIEVRVIDVAKMDFPVLRTREDFENGVPVNSVRGAQDVIRWAEHLVIIYPLWLGTMPALLKAFMEQVFRPDFALE